MLNPLKDFTTKEIKSAMIFSSVKTSDVALKILNKTGRLLSLNFINQVILKKRKSTKFIVEKAIYKLCKDELKSRA